MSHRSKKEVTPVISSTPEAKMSSDHKERNAPAAEVDHEGRDTNTTLDVSAISLNWTAVAHKTKFPDCWDVWRFKAMFWDGHNTSMYDRKGVRRNSDICGWNHRRSSLRVWCVCYVDPRGVLDTPFLRHAEKRCYIWRLRALVRRFG